MSSQTCAVHVSGGGELPCAWPDCSEGVAGSSIAVGAGATEFARVCVPSYNREDRYFWKPVRDGWQSIATDVLRRELALVQRELYTATHVYHYTTAAAFKEIIESQELWLSDYAYLNDSSEVRHGLTLADQVFEELLPTMSGRSKSLLASLLMLTADDTPRICVACFSFDRDGLTQWKGYGASTLGVAFGIDPIRFANSSGNARTAKFAPVIYDDATKRHLLRSFVYDWTMLYELEAPDSGQDPRRIYETLLRLHFFELLAMLKDEAFRDEREFRMIYQEHPRLFAEIPLDLAEKRYRVSGPSIIPYTTTRVLAGLRLAGGVKETRIEIVDVIVGPHPLKETAVSGIREFLATKGYSTIPVEPSRVPYR